MKWRLREWRAFGRAIATGLVVLSCAGGVAHADGLWDDGILRVSDLQDGASFDSRNGDFHFSDFDFTAIGFSDDVFDDYLVAPRDEGFRILLGFGGSPFDPGSSIEMTYSVATNGPFAIGGASIPLLGILHAMGMDPLVEVEWEASNGAMLATTTTTEGFVGGPSTTFDPVASLMVRQIISLSGVQAIVKVENAFEPVNVPEPGTGLLLACGLGVWAAARRRGAA